MENSVTSGKYVLITPARNEEDYIARTIESVVSQTLRPMRWVIVNDGSTDSTKNIVESYVEHYEFIMLVNIERSGVRNFGGKAAAFSSGVSALQRLDYDFIGNLDADISMAPDYYRRILEYFEADPKLGIAGGIVYTNIGKRFITTDETLDSVGGAVQLFRKACFEGIGGYPELHYGGIDAVAEIRARMLGWKVRKFPEHKVFENRRTGSAEASPLVSKVREGRRFYSLGYGFLFYVARCIYRTKDNPFIIGSIAALCGFMDSFLRRRPILMPQDEVEFLRSEQRQRLRRIPAKLFGFK